MFLTLGLTADVAAAHRHEYSPPRVETPKRSTYWSSADSMPDQAGTEREAAGACPRPSIASKRSEPTMQDRAVTGPESDLDAYSDSAYSRTNSITSSGRVAGSESRKRRRRPQISYQLAHPPPAVVHRQRLHIRPKLLLQLQRLSFLVRPTPALDVIPSSVCGPRFARKWPRFFPNKIGLGTNDLVVVESEEYQTPIARDGNVRLDPNDEGEDGRAVVATICQPRREDGDTSSKAEIRLSNGPLWQGTSLSTGGYEFVAVDEHGLTQTVRWVRRRPAKVQVPSVLVKGQAEPLKRFGFSIIDPRSRRHPILASLTQQTVDIVESSINPSAPTESDPLQTSGRRSSFTSTAQSSFLDAVELSSRPPFFQSEDHLRNLILVSGIWVAFREGWSGDFRRGQDRLSALPANAGTLRSGTGRSSSVPFPSRSRPRSNSVDNRDHSAEHQGPPHQADTSRGGRAGTTRNSTASAPKRANSTGTAFLRRAIDADRALRQHVDLVSPVRSAHEVEDTSATSPQPVHVLEGEYVCPGPREETVSATGGRAQRRQSRNSDSAGSGNASQQQKVRPEAERAGARSRKEHDHATKKWKKLKGLVGLFHRN